MKKTKLIIIIIFVLGVLSSCGPDKYKHTDNIVGQWKGILLDYNDDRYDITEETFLVEFKDDNTYTIVSTIPALTKDYYFISIPCRGEEEYAGKYEVASDIYLDMREDFRKKTRNSFSIKGDTLNINCQTLDDDQIFFTLIKEKQ